MSHWTATTGCAGQSKQTVKAIYKTVYHTVYRELGCQTIHHISAGRKELDMWKQELLNVSYWATESLPPSNWQISIVLKCPFKWMCFKSIFIGWKAGRVCCLVRFVARAQPGLQFMLLNYSAGQWNQPLQWAELFFKLRGLSSDTGLVNIFPWCPDTLMIKLIVF